jgi:hypothetical protein
MTGISMTGISGLRMSSYWVFQEIEPCHTQSFGQIHVGKVSELVVLWQVYSQTQA